MKKRFSKKIIAAFILMNITFGQTVMFCEAGETKVDKYAQPEITSISKFKDNVTQEKAKQDVPKEKQDIEGAQKMGSKEEYNSNNSLSKTSKTKKLDYVPGEIIVKYKPTQINLKNSSGIAKAKTFAAAKNLDKEEDIKQSNLSVLKIRDGKTVEDKVAELNNDPNVEYAQPNFQYYPLTINTNDTYKTSLWGLDNTGQNVNGVTSTNDADIDAPEAWAINEGTNASIIVAVIDAGVAYNHPDLATSMWDGTNCKDENGAALGGCNHGYDFEDGDKTPLPTNNSHGTHVAGTIAAAKNNNTGIVGVAPQAKIMALKFSFTTSEAVKAINFAKYNGAKVINASWGCTFYDQSEKDAIASFPGLFIAAAGNGESYGNPDVGDNHDTEVHTYPSDYNLDNIISVAATDQKDALATFSDYGASSVDVGAPGVNIYSTVSGSSMEGTTVLDEKFDGVTAPSIPSRWTKGGSNNYWGTYNYGGAIGNVMYGDLNYPYANNANTTIVSSAYNLNNASGATISFHTACDTDYYIGYFYDYMTLEYSSDGSTFTESSRWDEPFLDWLNDDSDQSGLATAYLDGNIPARYLTSNFKVRFRWVTDSSGNEYDGCQIDDIEITKYTDGSEGRYDYSQGTSMAAPQVAGLAALILGYKPELSSLEVKNVILTTGDSLLSLAGKTVSGKRINAFNALNSLNLDTTVPSLTQITSIPTPSENKTPSFVFSSSEAGAITYGGSCGSGNISQAVVGSNTATFNLNVGTYSNCSIVVTDSSLNSSVALSIPSFTITAPVPSSAKAITSFNLTQSNGIIDEVNHTIAVNVPFGTNVAALAPSITISAKATVSPVSGSTQNFSAPVVYTVTAEDGTAQIYTVTVNVGPDPVAANFTTISGSLTASGIQNNMNSVNSENVHGFNGLYFEKPAFGKITFSSSLDLTSSTTISFLQNLGTKLEMEQGLVGLNTVDSTVFAASGAQIQIYGFPNVNLPKFVFRVTANNGSTLTAEEVATLISNKSLDCSLGDSNCILTFDTLHFTTFNVTTDTVAPTATVSYDITALTNNNVVASLHPSEEVTVTSTGGLTHIFNSNGSFTFDFVDAAGNTGSAIATVNNIDKTAPVVTINPYNSTIPTKQDIVVTVSTNEGDLNFTSHTFTSNGSFDFVATDTAGNVTTQTVIITNIDKSAPLISITGNSAINVMQGDTYTDAGATATDNYDNSITVETTGTVDVSTLGVYTITYTATDTAGNVAIVTRTVNVVNRPSSERAITAFSFIGNNGTIDEVNHTISLTVPYGTDITALTPTVMVSAGASIVPGSGVAQNFTTSQNYIVTAEDNTSTQLYVVTVMVSPNPDIAFLAADKAALSENDILGTNSSLDNITAALANPLPVSGSINGSLIVWTSSQPQIISNDGQTIIRPSFSTGDKEVIMTATLTKGIITDTKTFTLVVKKLPVSIITAITSSIYNIGDNTIENVPFGTTKANFLTALSKGESNQIWDDTSLADPIVTGNTLKVTAEDGINSVIYSVVVLPNTAKDITSFKFDGLNPKVTGNISGTNITLNVPYGTNVTALVPTILISGESISPEGGVAQDFTSSKTYTVTAADNSTKVYTVAVVVGAAPSSGGGGGGSYTPPVTTVTSSDKPLQISSSQQGTLNQSLSGQNKVTVEIPKGSVKSNTTFDIKEGNLSGNDTPENGTGAFLFSGLVFNINATDGSNNAVKSFDQNLTITLTVSELPKDTSSLKLYYFDETNKKWVVIEGVVFGANTITFKVNHLTKFAVFETKQTIDTTSDTSGKVLDANTVSVFDGDIIQSKTSANPFAVYIVKIVNGKKYIRHIVSLDIFNHYKHLKWENLKQVGSLEEYSLSGWVRVNTGINGTAGANDKVYEINGDQTKHWINMTAEQFLTHGGSEEAIYDINKGELDLYANGASVMSL